VLGPNPYDGLDFEFNKEYDNFASIYGELRIFNGTAYAFSLIEPVPGVHSTSVSRKGYLAITGPKPDPASGSVALHEIVYKPLCNLRIVKP
jgi:hypothetical protein